MKFDMEETIVQGIKELQSSPENSDEVLKKIFKKGFNKGVLHGKETKLAEIEVKFVLLKSSFSEKQMDEIFKIIRTPISND